MAKKKRIQKFIEEDSSSSLFSEKPIQRNAANARERARMRVLSRAFGRLKTSLPWVPPDTKLSKLDTLRLASTYIAHLRRILGTNDGETDPSLYDGSPSHPIVLTWPFSIHNKPDLVENSACYTRSHDCENFGYKSFDVLEKQSYLEPTYCNKNAIGHNME